MWFKKISFPFGFFKSKQTSAEIFLPGFWNYALIYCGSLETAHFEVAIEVEMTEEAGYSLCQFRHGDPGNQCGFLLAAFSS